MKLKGIKKTSKTVEVEVSNRDIMEAVQKLVYKKYTNFGGGDNYIDKNGVWYVLEGYSHHNGDPDYRRGDQATTEEIRIYEMMKELYKIIVLEK